MRIAVLGTHQSIVGGTETYLRWLLPELIAKGHQVAFGFEYACPNTARALDAGARLLSRWSLREPRREVIEKISAFAPDVVFLQGLSDPRLESHLIERFRTMLYVHSFYGGCLTGFKRHTFPVLQPCQRRFGPACLAANYLLGCGGRRPDRVVKAFRDQRERARAMRHCGALVVASQYMREVYETEGMLRERIHVVPHPTLGVQPDLEEPKPRSAQDRVIFVGRVTQVKGLDHAIQAVHYARQRLERDLTLTVAGEGPELAASLRLAEKLQVPLDVQGWVDGPPKFDLMRSADILILPSTWPEPFGLVGLEAGCVGLPTVAYGVGGITEWLRPGESGEITAPAAWSPDELGSVLVHALNDEKHLNRLRRGAWQMAKTFTANRHLDSLEKIFGQVARS